MLYIDYKFFMDESGLKMADTHPDEKLDIERTPYKVGDVFVLTLAADGCMLFRKTKTNDIRQLAFNF